MGGRPVVAPCDAIKAPGQNMVLPGAARDALKMLPGFNDVE